MLTFIAQYWLQVLFGIIVTAGGFAIKRWVKVEKDRMIDIQKIKSEELRKEVKDEIITDVDSKMLELKEVNDKQNVQIENLKQQTIALTSGVLSLQGKQYRDFCRTLLAQEHEITIDEYEQEEEDYAAYKGLGGNHKGDTLHASVVKKYEAQLAARVQEKINK